MTGRCLSYGQGLTFWPLREIVAELAGTEDGDSPDEVLTRLTRLLPADDDRATWPSASRAALGVVDSTAYPEDIFWAVRKLLEAVASERPLVVVLEDVQWAEPTFLELIEYLPMAIGYRAGPAHRRRPSRALRHQTELRPGPARRPANRRAAARAKPTAGARGAAGR